jgi:methylenetetrahydrofolate dehydrogenase (NADP+)/methenyltetrahydrofolate cyclohydrolase
MTALLIDGLTLAAEIREEIRSAIASRRAERQRPCLAVVQVGEDPASAVYVGNKIKACEAVGIRSQHRALTSDCSTQSLLATISELNRAPDVHGILVQLPLPASIDSRSILQAIDPRKDVDGFHPLNAGALFTGNPGFVPCTPAGVMRLLAQTGIAIRGAEAVVVGASNIVGKPMAMLLLAAGATVTLCNSKTRDLAAHCHRAEIVIAALGKPQFIQGSMIKPGAVVIDVGIHRAMSGRLVGDVHFESVREIASWITPVPGGVGPMTIAMLLANTLKAAEDALP